MTGSYHHQVSYTQKLLMNEFVRRKRKNSLYSMRAFARSLALPSGRLSELISGKRMATRPMIEKLAKALKFSAQEVDSWIEAAASDRRTQKAGFEFYQVSPEEIEILADWSHFTILALMQTSDFKPEVDWIAKRLQISVARVQGAVRNLEHVGLIEVGERNWKALQKAVTTSHDIASIALQHAHREFMRQAIDSLISVDVARRDITSICVPINPDKIPEAKNKIKKFRRELTSFLMSKNATEVYRLNIQLFPTTFRKD